MAPPLANNSTTNGSTTAAENGSHESSTESNTTIIKWGLSGFGPRHALYLVYQAMVLLAYQDKLDAIKDHVNFKLHYTVFEKQGENSAGFGNAFQKSCDATVNTPVTRLPAFLGNIGGSGFQHLEKFADLPGTMYPLLKQEYNDILESLKKINPAAAALFKNAFKQDGVDRSVACMTRGKWGSIQLENINKALSYIQTHMQEKIQIDIRYSHEVTGVDFSTPTQPVIKFKRSGGAEETLKFDFVSFAHGTRLVSSVKPDVAPHAYERTPNHDTMQEYLESRGVLENGRLKPNVKIACTGLGLSFYDYATLLLAFLPGIDQCDNPAAFLEQIKADYQGLITVVSHGRNGPAPPRTALDQNWRGERSFFSARDMHALRLQRNSNWLPIAYEFLEAHIARTLKKVPAQVNTSVSVKEFAERYHKDNLQYPDSAATETGLLRAGYAAFSIGTGIVDSVDESEERLMPEAPLSRPGRLGYPLFSASCFEISSKESYDTDANTDFFNRWTEQLFYNYASPVPIQDIMDAMFTSGIAKHEEGGFEDVGFADGNFIFGSTTFDALLSPKKFDSRSDPVLGATVKKLVEGVPDYGKGGYFQTDDSEPIPIHAFDAGLGGSGTQVRKNGKKRTAGVQASIGITNGHGASSDWASRHAYHTLALAIAFCHYPNTSPIQTVGNIMTTKNLLKESEFKDEVDTFQPDWDDLQDRLFFLRLAADLAGESTMRYCEITDNIFSKETRDSFIEGLANGDKDKYIALKSTFKKNDYQPPTIFEFERRFPDYTKLQYEEILEVSFRCAEKPHPASNQVRTFASARVQSTTQDEWQEEGIYAMEMAVEEIQVEYPQGVFDLAYKMDYDRDYALIF